MILDAKALLAYFDRTADGHWSAAGEIEFIATFDELTVSPFVIAELEPIVLQRFGRDGWLQVLNELAGGAWTITPVDAGHLEAVRALVAEGETLAGASVAVLAASAAS